MSAARIRLIVAIVLFGSWLSWLTYLAVTATTPIVLSRPQFLTADAWVIAEVSGADKPENTVVIRDVVWQKRNDLKLVADSNLQVLDLNRVVVHWQGPGDYIVPLKKFGDLGYQIAKIPYSPGYPPIDASETDRMRIYPLTSSTQNQLDILLEAQRR